MAGYKNIIYEKRDGICWITLNRPDKLNAMNDAMLEELDAAFATAEPDLEVKVVVIKGAGQAFSVGQDLSGIGTSETLPSELGKDVSTKSRLEAERRRNRRWEYIFNLAKPTIAQVQGYYLGYGCHLAVVCDMTIAAEDALFGDASMRNARLLRQLDDLDLADRVEENQGAAVLREVYGCERGRAIRFDK